jgi:hypothetical protein
MNKFLHERLILHQQYSMIHFCMVLCSDIDQAVYEIKTVNWTAAKRCRDGAKWPLRCYHRYKNSPAPTLDLSFQWSAEMVQCQTHSLSPNIRTSVNVNTTLSLCSLSGQCTTRLDIQKCIALDEDSRFSPLVLLIRFVIWLQMSMEHRWNGSERETHRWPCASATW